MSDNKVKRVYHLIPKLDVCKEIPQWIICSDRAAYHPFTQTIFIKKGIQNFYLILLHELGHHLIHILGFKNKIQKYYDVLCWKPRDKSR